MPVKEQIQMRDPFVLTHAADQTYYLYGSTDPDIWRAKGIGFDVYTSKDLVDWQGPFPAFRPASDFWSDRNYWAPEVHVYQGRYYMFATFISDTVLRGTQILVADHPLGPFVPHSDGPVTPREWSCLDGTLYLDDEDKPWIVFCHEWQQIINGTICAQRLSEDLREAIGEPTVLFAAREAAWVDSLEKREGYVTDGPFVLKLENGSLLMLWSSFKDGKYAQGFAYSDSGSILGPWRQSDEPFYESDGGHGMIFHTFEGQHFLALHTPNRTPEERPIFLELESHTDGFVMKEQNGQAE